MLEICGLTAGYGAVSVLKGVSLKVNKGEIVTLIGANGAGKTTLLRAVSGTLPPRGGEVIFEGQKTTSLPPHKIVRLGLSLVPEGREILAKMTVFENLQMGAFCRSEKESEPILQTVYELFPVLKERGKQLGGTLSGGEQQMLAIGRALMAKPKLLMMDEPSLGLAPKLVNEVFHKIVKLKSSEVAILLVEQNARKALRTADRGYVLETGKIVLSGDTRQLLADNKVLEAYLGSKEVTRRQ
jgi:branched-chain amino acid transport system ATP-binding protein